MSWRPEPGPCTHRGAPPLGHVYELKNGCTWGDWEKHVMETGTDELRELRERVCDRFLITISLFVVPALYFSLARYETLGWTPLMYMHITAASLLWCVTLFRGRLPYAVRAGFIIFSLLGVGLGSLWQLGLVSECIPLLVIVPAVAVVLFNRGFARLVALFELFVFILIARDTVVSRHLPGLVFETYLVQVESWILLLMILLISAAGLLALTESTLKLLVEGRTGR